MGSVRFMGVLGVWAVETKRPKMLGQRGFRCGRLGGSRQVVSRVRCRERGLESSWQEAGSNDLPVVGSTKDGLSWVTGPSLVGVDPVPCGSNQR